jgi:hypothetical protein
MVGSFLLVRPRLSCLNGCRNSRLAEISSPAVSACLEMAARLGKCPDLFSKEVGGNPIII